jgi:hypothetical protein
MVGCNLGGMDAARELEKLTDDAAVGASRLLGERLLAEGCGQSLIEAQRLKGFPNRRFTGRWVIGQRS